MCETQHETTMHAHDAVSLARGEAAGRPVGCLLRGGERRELSTHARQDLSQYGSMVYHSQPLPPFLTHRLPDVRFLQLRGTGLNRM